MLSGCRWRRHTHAHTHNVRNARTIVHTLFVESMLIYLPAPQRTTIYLHLLECIYCVLWRPSLSSPRLPPPPQPPPLPSPALPPCVVCVHAAVHARMFYVIYFSIARTCLSEDQTHKRTRTRTCPNFSSISPRVFGADHRAHMFVSHAPHAPTIHIMPG